VHLQNLEKPKNAPTFNKPFLVIAHRGDSSSAPENTLPAFQKAIDLGADMIELDVQLTSDGVPVVFHDANLDKHSNGVGLLSDYPSRKIRSLDAGAWYSKEFTGEKIPLLTEVVELAKNRILLNIEIKPESVTENADSGIEYKVCELVRLLGMEEQVLISSFDYRVFERVHNIDPAIKTGLLYNREKSGRLSPAELMQTYQTFSFHCSRWQLRKKWIKECRQIGVPIYIYTVNGRRTMRSLIKKGIAGIFSDKPERLKQVSGRLLATG
jgi:glycerophosphoryl diester phosphodiesterase